MDQERQEHEDDVVIPVITEEIHADAVPVQTGGVRVTKRVEVHDEILAQELRKTHVDVKRVKTDRVVDGPQPVQRVGKTLIIPLVAEVLRVEKQWIVTEEIHITETEDREQSEQTVPVSREVATIEHLDEHGNPIASIDPEPELPHQTVVVPPATASILTKQPRADARRTLSAPKSMLDRKRDRRG